MPTILRFALYLAAVATILVATLGSGMLTDSRLAGAQQQLAAAYQQQSALLRGQVAAIQAHSAVAGYLNGDRAGRDLALSQRTELSRTAAEYESIAPGAAAAHYTAVVARFNAALDHVFAVYDTGGLRLARPALTTGLDPVARDLAAGQDQMLTRAAADVSAAGQALEDTRNLARTERTVAALMGLGLVLLLAGIMFVRQARPMGALARQARGAARAAEQALPEFTLDATAPRQAQELARALNGLVMQLREKYLALEQANAELQRLNEETHSANQAKTAFIANISHELRTPLNTVIGFSEMLLGEVYGPVNDKQRQQLERILRNSQQLLTLINDMLDLARVEAGKVSLSLTRIDAGQLAAGVGAALEPMARQKGLALQVQVAPHIPALTSDETRLRQVLLNLVSNAIKFTKQGSVTLWTGVDPALPNWIIFRVRDTGIGIPAAELDEIWKEFYQVSSGLSRTSGGSGLGLAIVRKLIELLGGDIEVESVEGQGSTVTVYVPLAPSESRDGAAGASLYAATGSYAGPK
jgi:signal transduction histidine kinase